MKAKAPPLTINKLLEALKGLPEKALLSNVTWQRILSGSDSKTPRMKQRFAPGQVSDLHGMITLTEDPVYERGESFRISAYGLVYEDQDSSTRKWLVPLTVWSNVADDYYRPRAAQFEGNLITHQQLISTNADEVPALVGFRTPDGKWADDSNPEWRIVLEENPGAEYPTPTVDPGWELLAYLAAPLFFPQPRFYVPRY
jgi:hypothetical protein